MAKSITLNVNGADHSVDAPPNSMLLYALRDNLKLHGPRFGCGLSECGACTVIMNGAAIRSCVTPLRATEGKKITTLEGLGTTENPSVMQQAFIDEQAGQCAYCMNGMIMTATAFLNKHPNPSRDDIKKALNDNLCRCGTHMRIVRAVERAAKNWSQANGEQQGGHQG